MKIFITGSTGYVGKLLLQEFTKKKLDFIEIKRSNVKSTTSSLSIDYESIAKNYQHGDWVLHLAWDMNNRKKESSYKCNVMGSKDLLDFLEKEGCNNIIFFSSVSANKNSQSVYGKHKYLVEELVKSSNGYIIRPGVIHDSTYMGGFVGSLRTLSEKFPILPDFWGNKKIFRLSDIKQIGDVLVSIIEGKQTINEISVDSSGPLTFRELINIITSKSNKLIRVPWFLGFYSLKFLEKMNLVFGVSSDSFLSIHPKNK